MVISPSDKDKICQVCKEQISKYKCPVCMIKFCCVACYKSHKTNEQCVKPQINSNEDLNEDESAPNQYEFETEDTVKPEKLNLLGLDKSVRKSLENPHLRDMIKFLNSTKNPMQGMEQAMQEPVFIEFVEHCLKVVED